MNIVAKSTAASVEVHGSFVDGREIEAGELLDVRNPATGEVIARIPNSTAADVDRAMKSARAAFEGRTWGCVRGKPRQPVSAGDAEQRPSCQRDEGAVVAATGPLPLFRRASPWGGVDDSGIGRECGTESFDDRFHTKRVMVATEDRQLDWYRDTQNQKRLN